MIFDFNSEHFSTAPIAKKIGVVVVLTTAITLFLLSVANCAISWLQHREHQIGRLETVAGITASSTEAALMFADRPAAYEYLNRLRDEKDLTQAVLFDSAGEVFARYSRDGEPVGGFELPDFIGSRADWSGVSYVEVIRRGDAFLGTVYLVTDFRTLRPFLWGSISLAFVLFILGLLVAYALSSRLSRKITSPIADLAQLAEQITLNPECSIKGKKVYRDEVGSLVDSFNLMLDRLERRDRALKESHRSLEYQVQERTVELKHANEDLRKAIVEARAASKAKSDFLSVMTHELRTPLNAILGMSELLAEEDSGSSQHDETISIIQKSSSALLSLVSDILDYSKIEAGQIDLEEVEFDLRETVFDPMIVLSAQEESKEIIFISDCAPDFPRRVIGDPTRLRQIITNLLSNAVKFTESGYIQVAIRRAGPLDAPTLEVSVRDTGIGIPKGRLDRLFQHFSQVDASMTRRYGGSGLGLAISQRLALAMDGEILVESEEGQGSIFTVSLPLKTAADSSSLLSEMSVKAGSSVRLIGFDNPLKGVLERLSESLGVKVVDRFSDPQKFGGVPVIYGHGLSADEVKEVVDSEVGECLMQEVIVACRQSATAAMREALGCKVLSLPIMAEAYAASFRPSPEKALGALDGHSTKSPGDFKLKILLAEDNLVNQRVFLRMLQSCGDTIKVVENGQKAVEAATREHFDIIFMDYMMPILDGLEAIKIIRRELSNNFQPCIVALTANAEKKAAENLKAAGADVYLSKPVRRADLLLSVNEVRLKRMREADELN